MKNRIGWYCATVWFVLFCTFIVWADVKFPQALVSSDFHMNFYSSAYLALHGKTSSLYPAVDAVSFKDSPFDLFLHQLFPTLSKKIIGTYPYSPLVALLFVPLALMPANIALLCWQLSSVAALSLVAYICGRLEDHKFNWNHMVLAAFVFCPTIAALWIGQVSIILGLLPLTLGYMLLRNNKDLLGGLVWSVFILKPQYFPIVLLTAILTRRWKLLAGLVGGTAAIVIAEVFCVSPALFMQWMQTSVRLTDSGQTRVSADLVATLPNAIMLTLPTSMAGLRPIIYGICGVHALIGIGTVGSRLARRFKDGELLDVVLLLNLLSIVLYSRLVIYDLTLLIFAGYIIFLRRPSAEEPAVSLRFRRLAYWIFWILTVQTIVAVFAAKIAIPLVFLIPLAVCVTYSWLLLMRTGGPGEVQPMVSATV